MIVSSADPLSIGKAACTQPLTPAAMAPGGHLTVPACTGVLHPGSFPEPWCPECSLWSPDADLTNCLSGFWARTTELNLKPLSPSEISKPHISLSLSRGLALTCTFPSSHWPPWTGVSFSFLVSHFCFCHYPLGPSPVLCSGTQEPRNPGRRLYDSDTDMVGADWLQILRASAILQNQDVEPSSCCLPMLSPGCI